MYKVFCIILALATVCSAQWVMKKGNVVDGKVPLDYDFVATNGNIQVEAMFVAGDKIYDMSRVEVPKEFAEVSPKDADARVNAAVAAGDKATKGMQVLHGSSLSLRILISDKELIAAYQGDHAAFPKKTKARITKADVALVNAQLKAWKSDNARANAIIEGLPGVFDRLLDTKKKAMGGEIKSTGAAARAAFMSVFEKGKRVNTNTNVRAGNFRYYIDLWTGAAFHVTPGHHSGTTIALIDEDTDDIIEGWLEGNHGRTPAEGLTFKCTHRGALFDGVARPQFTCTTSYWAFWCFRGPNFNCNAQAGFQMDVADSPNAPPAPNTGKCATYCPIRSYDC